MIDEKQLIERLLQKKEIMVASKDGRHEVSIEAVIAYISSFPKVCEWIPCSKRLPKKTGCYIVMIKGAEKPTELLYLKYSNEWVEISINNIDYYDVLAWMELPDPYVEKPEAAAGCKENWKDAVMRHFEKVE